MDFRLCPACQRVHPAGRECPDCREPFVLVGEDFFLGKRIGKYQIESMVGLGGMGIVYRVRHTGLGRPAALKIVIPEMGRDEVLRRFHQEARILGGLKHPNIVEVIDLDVAPWGFPYIVMEFLEGRSLRAEIARHPGGMPYPLFARLFRPMVSAVAYAHGRGVVHRDLKPDNVFLQEAGGEQVVKVLDFGLAKIMAAGREQNDLTRSGAVLGTPNYIAPEQLAGQEAGPAADQYALGLIAAEMLTGKALRDGLSIAAIVQGAIAEPVNPLTFAGVADAPPGFGAAIVRATHPTPGCRFLHVQGLLDALEGTADPAAVPTTPVAVPSPPAGRSHRSWRAVWGRWGTVAFAALLALLALLWTLRPDAGPAGASPRAISVAVVSFDNRTGNDAYDYLQDAIPNLLITSLEQAGGVRVVTWERLHDLLHQRGPGPAPRLDAEVGLELCHREGIRALVTGSFVKAGDVFLTDVKVLDAGTRELLRTAQARGEGVGSILTAQVDALSREIAHGLPSAPVPARAAPVSEVTTGSMEAYNYFLRGRDELDRYNYNEAVVFLSKAVELDPEFAVAYAYLGSAYDFQVDAPKTRENIERARALSEHAGDRERRMIDALHAKHVERDETRSLKVLNDMIARYPEEKWAYLNRGIHFAYFTDRSDRALADYRKALDLDPDYAPALNELGYTYAERGEYDRAFEQFSRYATVSPGDPNPFDSMGDVLAQTGRLEEAEAKYAEALEVKPDWPAEYAIAYLRALREDYAGAREWVDRMLEAAPPSRKITMGLWWSGFYRLWLGDPSGARERADELRERARREGIPVWERNADLLEAWVCLDRGETARGLELLEGAARWEAEESPDEATWQRGLLEYYRGWTSALARDLETARGHLAALRREARLSPRVQRTDVETLGHRLEAEILLAEGKAREAEAAAAKAAAVPSLSFTWTGIRLHRHNEPWFHDQRARALAAQGRLAEAVAEYERLIVFDPAGSSRRLIHPLYHLRLSGLYEQAGAREPAVRACRRFLELWNNADPDRPEILEARARLGRLGA